MGLVEQLLHAYPDCDRMMAETIVKMHEQGTLTQFICEKTQDETKALPEQIGGHLKIEESKKIVAPSIEWSEDKCQD